jgi:6-pyruvoyltetrahydropterin/6-carboxytetrahydropterin synthase
MAHIRITKRFGFEMAHALAHYDGLCRNIHGHSYHLDVTVKGAVLHDENSSKNGMVMDFGELKQLVMDTVISKIDHALLLNRDSDTALIKTLQQHFDKVLLVDYQPTTENMLADFARQIAAQLPPHVTLERLRMSETDSSYAEWYSCDNN